MLYIAIIQPVCIHVYQACLLRGFSFFYLHVQRNVAGSSPAMEFLGFKNCMGYLLGCGVVISTLITDRHASIRKYMREQLKNIRHYFDLWHIKKSKSQIWLLILYPRGVL